MGVQEMLDQPSESMVSLPEGFHRGPVVIRRACTVCGQNTTIWSEASPVIRVEAPNVKICDLRVHLNGMENIRQKGQKGICVQTAFPDTILSNVELNGALRGFPDETEEALQTFFPLGTFAAGPQINRAAFPLNAPAPLRLSHSMRGVELSVDTLAPGYNPVILSIRNMENARTLYGPIFASRLDGGVIRRIYISGQAVSGARPLELPSGYLPALRIAIRGERSSVPALSLRVRLDPPPPPDFEIEPFVFLLDSARRVRGDGDLVYFGNPSTETGSVHIQKQEISLFLDRIDLAVGHVLLCFAIYSQSGEHSFDRMKGRTLLLGDVHSDVDYCGFPFDGLPKVKTMRAIEFYRRGGEWRVYFEGQGYAAGLEKLCENCGLAVQ